MVTEVRTEVELFPETEEVDNEAILVESIPLRLRGLIPLEYVGSISLGPALPDDLLLGRVRDGRLRVRSPFRVKVAAENDDVIVEADELSEFGFGKNLTEALADLERAIAELYFTLHEERSRLGPDLASVYATLDRKLERTHDDQGT